VNGIGDSFRRADLDRIGDIVIAATKTQ
jgi:hypothetical protein